MENLKDKIAGLTKLPAYAVGDLLDVSTLRELPKGSFFIRAGEQPRKMAFVLKGLFRYVYTDDEGNEYTKSFMPAGSFLSSYTSMINGEASYYAIEALEDSSVVVFEYEAWQGLRAKDRIWTDLLVTMLERGYGAKERRERELLLLSAEARYQNFCAMYPGLIGRIKQHQIASFLGIKPESLSRIRKNMDT